MKTRIFAIAMAATVLAGCTTTESMKWVGVGGSKADGTVILGIDVPPKFGIVETHATWDVDQANAEADRRCKNWGYAGAALFGGDFPVHIVCHQPGISPCGAKTYRVNYQCVDKGSAK